MTPVEILTLAPLAALVVVFGVLPGLLLELIEAPVATVLADVARQEPLAFSREAVLIGVAIPVLYAIGRLLWVARIDLSRREAATGLPADASGSAR